MSRAMSNGPDASRPEAPAESSDLGKILTTIVTTSLPHDPAEPEGVGQDVG
jgi:hypothetical protein